VALLVREGVMDRRIEDWSRRIRSSLYRRQGLRLGVNSGRDTHGYDLVVKIYLLF
jgi:hypothetical protein